MSKRRRRKKPNISQDTLDRAREEAGLPAEEDQDEDDAGEDEVEQVEVSKAAPVRERKASGSQRRRKRTVGAAQLDKRKAEGKLNSNYIADMLEHPTKTVTDEELRAEYGFVLKDLRNMGLLAASLFLVLIFIAVVIL